MSSADGDSKPLDFGADGINGSLDAYGRLIALNTSHPQYGYVTLTSADPFPEAERYNPASVRAYRAGLAGLQGFGVTFDETVISAEASLLEDVLPHIRLGLADGSSAEVTTFSSAGGVFQQWEVTGSPVMRWSGRVSLQRCAYTQLTEGGPIPPPPIETHVRLQDGVLTIYNPALNWAVGIAGLPIDHRFEYQQNNPIDLSFELPAGTFTLTYGFGTTPDEAVSYARELLLQWNAEHELEKVRARWRLRWAQIPADRLLRRGLSYSMAMAVPAGGEGVCLLTDHMLLPLVWNRDAYYMARALLSWSPEMAETVRRHLIWTFEQAECPDGYWGRCYLANGRMKDAAFQLDQQLYPLLELVEYTQESGDYETYKRLLPHIPHVLDGLTRRRAPDVWLFPTDETPADDPIPLPYHLSSHILLWYTLTRLDALQPGLDDMAANIRAAIDTFFVTEQNGKRLYAYATDGKGHFHLYHDANDFPLVLAPLWGMCAADDPVWRATVEFAFSEANQKGVYAGRLGSVHTPAPWPLGDVQELIVSRLVGDQPREQATLARLERISQADGSLPEAYNEITGAVISRHWFGWPGAAYACIQLNAFVHTGKIIP